MESMRSKISTSIQKIDLIYQILIRVCDSLSSGATPSPESGSYHNAHTSNDPRSFGDDGALTIQGEAVANEHHHNVDSRHLDRDRGSYPNNGYANLPSGANYRYDIAEWVTAGQDLSIDNNGARIVSATTPMDNRQQIREQDLSPQIQIQRLTAQLTAAYNRIAALEEQLLAKRWK
jgi:hypothetical protein